MDYLNDDRLTSNIDELELYKSLSVRELYEKVINRHEGDTSDTYLENKKIMEELKGNVNSRLLNNRRVISLGKFPGFFIIDKDIRNREEIIIKLYVNDNMVGEVVGKGAKNLKIIIDELYDVLEYGGRIILKVYGKDGKDDIETIIRGLNSKNNYRIVYNYYGENIEMMKEGNMLMGFDRYGILTFLSLDVNDMNSEHIVYKNVVKIYECKEVYNNLNK